MPHFSRNNSCAFTWTKAGDCHAVHITRKGQRCLVSAHWHGGAGKNTAVAETLNNAKRALGNIDSYFTLAGGSEGGWGMADVLMPELKAEELKSALAFELRKHTPLPADKLVWGYRLIPSEAKNKLLVRLFYVRNETWRQWADAVGGIGQVDMILPPPVALDPLLAGQAVTIPGDSPANAFVFTPGDPGRNMAPRSMADQAAGDGRLQEILPLDNLDLGSLKELPAAEQLRYAGAILLAVYGLTREAGRDQATVIRVPEALQPRRYRGFRLLATLLAIYICAGLFFGLVRAIQNRVARLRDINSELHSVETQINGLQKQLNPDNVAYANAIKQELTEVVPEAPTFPAELLELTRLIEAPSWMSSRLEWKDGQVSFQLEEEENDLELATRLEHSPILGDVREQSSTFDPRNNRRIRKFLLNARYDTEKEQEAALNYAEAQAAKRLKEAEAARARAAEEAAAAADEEAAAGTEEINALPAEAPAENSAVATDLPPPPPPPPPPVANE
ncbi:MAG: hypothetical protein GX945_05475 [Lentisphaerae bacterium]|nr:hypothetical protein [Lentisphaerota bacterium]